MPKDRFNEPLKLINPKPNANQMIENDYAFYMFPIPTIKYANKKLTDRERRLYFAISGQAGQDKQGKSYCWPISHYCKIANIKSNHYSEVLQGLCEKGFIIHNNFKSIEVLYPISEEEYITPTGRIQKKANSQNGNISTSNMIEFSSNGYDEDDFGKENSQSWANNKDIYINKKISSLREKKLLCESEFLKIEDITIIEEADKMERLEEIECLEEIKEKEDAKNWEEFKRINKMADLSNLEIARLLGMQFIIYKGERIWL